MRQRPSVVRGRAVLAGGLLGCVLLLTSACGDDPAPEGRVPDPAGASPPGEPTEQGRDGVVAHREVAVVSGANAGGSVSSAPAPLPDEASLETWVSQFGSEQLRDDLRSAAAGALPGVRGADEAMLGAVLSIGCEQPVAWSLERVEGDLRVQVRMPKPTRQCLVPVTTVALLAVDEDEAAGLAGPQ